MRLTPYWQHKKPYWHDMVYCYAKMAARLADGSGWTSGNCTSPTLSWGSAVRGCSVVFGFGAEAVEAAADVFYVDAVVGDDWRYSSGTVELEFV